MTLSEFVQPIWPGLSNEEARRLLWNATCYPFGDEDRVTAQLREKHEQSNGNVELAITIAHDETDAAMTKIRLGTI